MNNMHMPLPVIQIFQTAWVTLEYRAEKEGYWTGKRFKNVKNAARIIDLIYPSASHTIVWIFDQSSCHREFSDNALNVHRMNVRPGGAQPAMRDGVWGRKGTANGHG